MNTVSNSTEDISGKECSIDWYLPLQITIPISNPEFITGRFADNHYNFYLQLLNASHCYLIIFLYVF